MKIKSFMMLAAMALVFGMSSCGSDDDAPAAPLATQVAGTYIGDEVVMVNNEESSNDKKPYVFTKATDATIDMVIPEVGMGMMTIPSVTVKGIILSKKGNDIIGALTNYEGTINDKAFVVSGITVLFSGNLVTVKFSEKYGKMPFNLETTFVGTKK